MSPISLYTPFYFFLNSLLFILECSFENKRIILARKMRVSPQCLGSPGLEDPFVRMYLLTRSPQMHITALHTYWYSNRIREAVSVSVASFLTTSNYGLSIWS